MGARSTWLPDRGDRLDGPKQATATQTPGLRRAHPSQMQLVDTMEVRQIWVPREAELHLVAPFSGAE